MMNEIDITPSTSVYATYKRLSYTPWFAIAEFVDNSTQSYYDKSEELKKQVGFKKLYININYNRDKDILEIIDNAYGMEFIDFERALILDKPPKNTKGRNEFGMGLKTAACWFGTIWSVETTALGSDKSYYAVLDIEDLQTNKTQKIQYTTLESDKSVHYTKIVIEKLNEKMATRTLSRIKEQLSSIYRNDIRQGEIEIIWNGDILTYDEPPVLVEEDESGEEVIWKKGIDFEILGSNGKTYFVKGWVAIRDPGSTSNAGFTLMRRGRVIKGGPGENYRPGEIFGKSNSFTYQRLIGELNLDNWEVTQAKDGFNWHNGLEDELIEKLLYECKEYIYKAENYRKNESRKIEDISQSEKEEIITETVTEINKAVRELEEKTELQTLELDIPEVQENTEITPLEAYSYNVEDYTIVVKWYDDNEFGPWITTKEVDGGTEIWLNMRHAFFVPFISDTEFLKLINKFACSMIIAEKNAVRTSSSNNGYVEPFKIREYMNKLLEVLARM